MSTELISQLSEVVCWKIENALDRFEKPNWKTLISKMPKNYYDEKAVNKFHMSILKRDGSPTREMLNDLGKKRRKTADLIKWLREIGNFEELIETIRSNGTSLQNMGPSIKQQPPPSVRCIVGERTVIRFKVNGSDSSLQYQWFREQNALSNETRNELNIVHANRSHSGFYTCRIANDFGCVFTNWCHLEIIERQSATIPQVVQATSQPIINYEASNLLNGAPVITMHPRSVIICTGETLILKADVAGRPTPALQWFYEDQILPNQCSNTLTIHNVNPDLHDGFYTIYATNQHGSTHSLAAQVIINKARPTHARGPNRALSTQTMSTLTVTEGPTAKIALLIGNQNYKSQDALGALVHPINDMLDIAGTLMSIDFKVVSLIDLDLTAMKEALDFFYSIISPGCYVLFYFAGHGFEINGKNYLMPIDASPSYEPSENFPLSDVLFAVTQKKAKLSVLLVDSCRTEPANIYKNPMQSLMPHLSMIPNEDGVQRKNVLIGFGCCSRGRVLESPIMRNGYFAKFLTDFLARDIRVEDILYEVSRSINQERIIDPATGRMQIVYRQSTLVDEFKLTDRIVEDGEINEYSLAWQIAHTAPKPCTNLLPNSEKLKIELHFSAECSNCLLIRANVTKITEVDFHLDFIMPQRIGGANVNIIKDETKKFGKVVRISNLEKLEGDIEINIVINVDGEEKFALYKIKEKPLYAKVIEAFRKLPNNSI